jgi:hypothetical protein
MFEKWNMWWQYGNNSYYIICKVSVSIHFVPKGQITQPSIDLTGQVMTEKVIPIDQWCAR